MLITVKKLGLTKNGNRIFHYNFIDDKGINQNELFKYFGRLTKTGISNNNDTYIMIDWFKNTQRNDFKELKRKGFKELETFKIITSFMDHAIKNGFTEL